MAVAAPPPQQAQKKAASPTRPDKARWLRRIMDSIFRRSRAATPTLPTTPILAPVRRAPRHTARRSPRPIPHLPVTGARPLNRIAIVNHKGGVGKTSTTIHLAGVLVEMGYRVAIFDCDSQGDLSAVFLTDHEKLPYSITDVFAGTGVAAKDILQPTAFEGIFVAPADHRLNLVDKTHGFEHDANVAALADAVSQIERDFDFILFDCPPRPHLSGYAALVAAREVIVPCQPSQFSVRSLATLSDEVRRVQQTLNPQLRVRGYFLSLVSPHSTTQATCRRLLTGTLGADRVFKTAIPLMPAFDTAINLRKPITEHARSSPAAAVFRRFALELLGVPLTHAHPGPTA